MEQSFSVEFRYPVIYSDAVLSADNACLRDLIDSSGTPRVAVFVDAGLAVRRPKIVREITAYLGNRLAAAPKVIAGGEAGKDGMEHVLACAAVMDQAKIDRHAYVVAIGGGAMLDVVGFAAAIAHRGVRLIRIPTTVLAQNDAGIGVKNGVNCFGKKNFLGTFAPPFAVMNDFSLLKTLTADHWRDGTAEAVKIGLIREANFFEWIEANAESLAEAGHETFRHLIQRCAELHLEHITTSGDSFERGSARPLDFGHWSAHKLESLTTYRISHGHAVAIGMAIDMTYAMKMKICDAALTERVIDCLKRLGFRFDDVAVDLVDELMHGIEEFREHLGGQLSIAMIRRAGERVEVSEIDRGVMREAIGDVLG